MIKNVKNAWKEKKLGWIVNLLDLKMVHWIVSVKNVKNHRLIFSAIKKKYLSLWIYRKLGKIWWKYNTTQEAFYSELNLENITDKDNEHVKNVWEAFEIKNLSKYHDLYVQCDTFLLADVFQNFRDKCIEIYELDPAHFLSASGLAW